MLMCVSPLILVGRTVYWWWLPVHPLWPDEYTYICSVLKCPVSVPLVLFLQLDRHFTGESV